MSRLDQIKLDKKIEKLREVCEEVAKAAINGSNKVKSVIADLQEMGCRIDDIETQACIRVYVDGEDLVAFAPIENQNEDFKLEIDSRDSSLLQELGIDPAQNAKKK